MYLELVLQLLQLCLQISNPAILLLSLHSLQILYLLALRIVLPEIFDHEAAAALDDVLDHLLWAARADSG